MRIFQVRPPAALASLLLWGLVVCLQRPGLAATATPSSPPAASPVPSASSAAVDQKALARAKSWYGMLQSGSIDRSQLTKAMNDGLTADKVSQISAQLKPLGTPASFAQLDMVTVAPYSVYHYRIGYASSAIVMTFALDPSGKIAGINLRPESTNP